jgi:CHAT domain-containing protein
VSRALQIIGLAALAAVSVGSRVSARQAQEPVERLTPGSVIDATVPSVGPARFRLPAVVGDLLQIRIERAADLILSVTSPSGEVFAERHRVEFLYPTEQLSFIAEAAGEYVLAIHRRQPTSPGRFLVTFEGQRPSQSNDEPRVRAERARDLGDRLRRAERAEAYSQAVAAFGEALTISRALGDRLGEAEALLGIGLSQQRLGATADAAAAFNAALEAGRAAEEWSGEARALNALGQVHRLLGEMAIARDRYSQSVEAARRIGDRWTEVGALNSLARVASDTGDPQTALAMHAEAIGSSREFGDRGGEAFALNNIGNIHQTLGDFDEALASYEQALAIRQAIGSAQGASSTMSNIGRVHLARGEPERARPYFEQSLETTRRIGSRDNEGRNLSSLGSVYLELGDPAKAVSALEQATAVCVAVGDRFCQGDARTTMARAKAAIGRGDEARADIRAATTLMVALGDIEGEARARVTAAAIEASLGDLGRARAQAEATVALIETMRIRLASPMLRASYLAASRDAYELYVDVLMRSHAVEPDAGYASRALHVSERARARNLLERLAETRENIREGVDPALLERERSISSQINRAGARRALLLAGRHTESDRQTVEQEIDDLVATYRQLEAEIRIRSPRFASLTQPEPLSLEEIQRQVVDRETLLLEYSLGQDRSYLWAVTPGTLRAYVLPGRATIEKAARRTHALMQASHRPGQAVHMRAAAAELSALVLGPAAAELANKRLVIVPDGALQLVPFAALPRPAPGAPDSTPLIVRHEIVVLPSASLVPALRSSGDGRLNPDRVVAVFADPVLQRDDARFANRERSTEQSKDKAVLANARDLARAVSDTGVMRFERLRYTRDEARAIVGLAGAGSSLFAVDFDANRAAVLKPELSRYRFVHFATHALLNTRHPELSGVVLSLVDRDGLPQDGFLRLHDIYNLRLSAELVVLSACQTALGRDFRGEGLVGLTRGFMYAGARVVVATLWDVRDEQTSKLMERFYAGMMRDGLRPAAALRAAQLSMLEDPAGSSPVYWAGFVLQGDWQ